MKKILIVFDHPTHPIVSGNRMCVMQYVKVLQDNGYDVYLLYIHNNNSPDNDRNDTLKYWGKKIYEYKISKLQYYIQRLFSRFKENGNERFLDLYYPWGLTSYIEKLHKINNFSGLICNYVWLSKAMNCSISNKRLYTHDVFSNRNLRLNGAQWLAFPV